MMFKNKNKNYFLRRSGILGYIFSDIELRKETYYDIDGFEKIDGFYFMSKKPFSRMYQWHAIVGLEHVYTILKLIEDGIKDNRKAVVLKIKSGLGKEEVYIWKGSLYKAKELLYGMIKEIQKQY